MSLLSILKSWQLCNCCTQKKSYTHVTSKKLTSVCIEVSLSHDKVARKCSTFKK